MEATETTRVQVLSTSIFVKLDKEEMKKWNSKDKDYFFISLNDQNFCKKILEQTDKTEDELKFIKQKHKQLKMQNFECRITNAQSVF